MWLRNQWSLFFSSFKKKQHKANFQRCGKQCHLHPSLMLGILPGKVLREEETLVMGMIAVCKLTTKSQSWGNSQRLFGLHLQGNHTWVFPNTEFHSTCICLFSPLTLHLLYLLEDIQIEIFAKNKCSSACHTEQQGIKRQYHPLQRHPQSPR